MGGSSFLYLKREDCNRVSVCRENLLWRKIDRTARLRDSSGDIQRFNRKTVSAMLCPANNAAVADGRPGIALNLRIGLLCIVWSRHKQAEEVFFACDSNCRSTQFPAHSREHMKNCRHGHFHKTTTEQSTNKFGV